MKITLSNLSGHSETFKNISNSDDFIKKIFAVAASSRKEPLSIQRQPKPSYACSLESIDAAYESDSESINDTKLLNADEFKHKVSPLKVRLYKFYESTFYNGKDIINVSSPSEQVKQKTNIFSQKKIIHVNNKIADNRQYNSKALPLPKSTFEFKGNILQTKTSALRTQYIKQHYKLSNKSTPLDYKTQKTHLNRNINSIKNSDLMKISNSIKKEQRLTMEMNALKDNILKIQKQIHINDNLLNELKKQTIQQNTFCIYLKPSLR